jgi:bacteriorhodopsin
MSEKSKTASLKKNTSWLWIIVAVVVILAIILLAI